MENKENKSRSKTKFESTLILKNALHDAEMLLAHAAEYGIEIEPKHIKAIVEAKSKEQNESWTEEDEINLWQAYQTISKEVQPVTIDSIRAASEIIEEPKGFFVKLFNIKRRSSLVRRSVKWYSGLALLSMLLMLALQIYSLQGTKYLANLEAGIKRLSEIEDRTQQLLLMDTEDRSISMEKDQLDIEMNEKMQEVKSNIKLLETWLDFTYNIWSKSPKHIHEDLKASSTQDELYGPPDFTETGGTTKNIVVIQQAKSLLIILNQYILPLMYGLLGGFAFVLRSLASETKSMTYTAVSNIKYALRIHLGALAGLVVGFLWGDISSSSFMANSFSPLAVAFIAGYSVEFMFRLFDSIIGNKDDKKGNDSKKPD